MSLPSLWYFVVKGNSVGRSSNRVSNLLNLSALDATKTGINSVSQDVSTFCVDPSLALVTHDPLFAIIGKVEIDLFTVYAIELFLVLLQALITQILHVVFIVSVVLGILILRADLIAAYVRASVA